MTVTSNGSGAVGLVLRASDDYATYAFTVDPIGRSWSLAELTADRTSIVGGFNGASATGTSDAIHPGYGATNRLSVVMHGRSFVLYVNDQFVSVISGAIGSGYYVFPAPQGQVGVFATGAGTYSFRDFAVYSIPAA